MKERFEFEGTSTGEYRSGLYVTYSGIEYPAKYLGMGRFILYSDYPDDNFIFPTENNKYLLQTDLRDDNLTCASEIHMIGIIKECFESVMINNILEEGIVVSTTNPRIAFQLSLKPNNNSEFTGLIDKSILVGYYEERDYLWNPYLGIYSSFCQAIEAADNQSWFIDKDRMTKFFIMSHKQ